MIKLVCHTSRLKGDDGRLRRKPFGHRMCIECNLAASEDAKHMVMECPSQIAYRTQLYNRMQREHPDYSERISFSVLMGGGGGAIPEAPAGEMLGIWVVASTYIANMYWQVLRNRLE